MIGLELSAAEIGRDARVSMPHGVRIGWFQGPPQVKPCDWAWVICVYVCLCLQLPRYHVTVNVFAGSEDSSRSPWLGGSNSTTSWPLPFQTHLSVAHPWLIQSHPLLWVILNQPQPVHFPRRLPPSQSMSWEVRGRMGRAETMTSLSIERDL